MQVLHCRVCVVSVLSEQVQKKGSPPPWLILNLAGDYKQQFSCIYHSRRNNPPSPLPLAFLLLESPRDSLLVIYAKFCAISESSLSSPRFRPSTACLCSRLVPGSGYISESESAAPDDRVVSNAVILRVPAKREAMLRDMLAFSSDGEGMDGPQVNTHAYARTRFPRICNNN